ncbi:hypothetical protein AK830_g4826 [Neonectria ditissima]|uniref:Uncharacterized protein n=1 Tax=Neonectria ditissima TaxID=78410 RepID=A0A0P7B785_9HYPO|nr:hypothetical protein AK830_g4826 [Neonectria ditissima]
MASLVPIQFESLTARYHGLGRKLKLQAKGEIPGYFLTPFFDQEIWEGGLRFSIKAYSGGFGKLPPTKKVEFDFELPILLPIPHFSNKTVIIETAFGVSKVEIEYLEWPEPPADEESVAKTALDAIAPDAIAPTSNPDKKNADITSVLPPIDYFLTDKGTLTLTGLIPKELKSYVDIDFNKEFIKLDTTSVGEGFIKWTVAWNKIPTGADDPQRINVITTIKHDVAIPIWPPISNTTRVIQPYIVSRVWLVAKE